MKKINIIILFFLIDFTAIAQSNVPYTGPIIDMHIHAYAEGHPMFGMTHPPTLRKKTYSGVKSADEQREQTLAKFNKYKIVRAVVAHGELWAGVDEPVILIGQADKDTAALRRQFNAGKLQAIAEMSPFYAGMRADDPTVMPYFELAQDLDIPIGFHVLPGGPNGGLHFMPRMLGGMRAKNAGPLQLEEVLVKYPDLKLYIMHGGWPYVEDVKALMYMHPNVYVDIAVLNWVLPQQELESYLKALFDAGFGGRIMYGSDQMVWPETMDDAIASVNAVPFLTVDQKADIFYNNAARFLGLSEGEIAADRESTK